MKKVGHDYMKNAKENGVIPKQEIIKTLGGLASPWIKAGEPVPPFSVKEVVRTTGLSPNQVTDAILQKDSITVKAPEGEFSLYLEDTQGERVNGSIELSSKARANAPAMRALRESRYQSRAPGGGPIVKARILDRNVRATQIRLGKQRLRIKMEPFINGSEKRRKEIVEKQTARMVKKYEIRENAQVVFDLQNEIAQRTPSKSRELPSLRLPNIAIENEPGDSAQLLGMDQLACLTESNVMYLLGKMAQSPNLYGITSGEREEVKTYMVDKKTKETLRKISGFLSDLSKIPDTVLLPETEDEMSCLLTIAANAITTGRPITLATPICPDWSRDSEGKYDFKSLGDGESFIAAKFFANAPAILSAFENNGIPFAGMLQFADWGLETEIDAKGTYGQKLSQEDIQRCFASTIAATNQTLAALQRDPRLGKFFSSYRVVSMKECIARNIDEKRVKAKMRRFFTTDEKGRGLLEKLATQSFSINQKRLGLSPAQNREFALTSLVEYATEGEALDEQSILIVCESRTTTRCYNMPKDAYKKVPVFYVKGQGEVDEGVNIL